MDGLKKHRCILLAYAGPPYVGYAGNYKKNRIIDDDGWHVVCDDHLLHVQDHLAEFYDDLSGKKLDTQKVLDTRREEFTCSSSMAATDRFLQRLPCA